MSRHALRADFNAMYDGDAWGQVSEWLFTIAAELHHNRGVALPDAWRYRPSPLGNDNDPDSFIVQAVIDAATEELQAFGDLLFRYSNMLRRHGKDY